MIWALLGSLAAVLAWAGAPALSSQPYLPGAVDFEQPLSGVARVVHEGPAKSAREHRRHPGEGPVSFRSDPITAPERFDLAGLGGEMRRIELRAREEGQAWSEWIETANGDPVYFDGADELQVRTRGWRPQGTLHYVNVSGTTSAAGSLLSSFRRAVNSAFISASSAIDAEAGAAPARPQIIPRAEWGANSSKSGCPPRTGASFGPVKGAVVHHTVTATDYPEADAASIVLGICRYHRNGNGWNDIGYNGLVDRFGNLYEGRAGGLRKGVVGAHAQGFNAQTTGIAAIGTHTEKKIGAAALDSLVAYLAWKLTAHGLPARGKVTMTSAGGDASRYESGAKVRLNRIIGHRDVGLTSCPGDAFYLQLASIRRLTEQLVVASGGPATTPPGGAEPPSSAPEPPIVAPTGSGPG